MSRDLNAIAEHFLYGRLIFSGKVFEFFDILSVNAVIGVYTGGTRPLSLKLRIGKTFGLNCCRF